MKFIRYSVAMSLNVHIIGCFYLTQAGKVEFD